MLVGLITVVGLLFAWHSTQNLSLALPSALEDSDPDVVSLVKGAYGVLADDTGDASRWVELGMALEAHGWFDVARECYARAVALDDGAAKWWYRLALVQAQLGEGRAAVASMKQVVARIPAYAPAHWRMGFWLLDHGDPAAAQTAFEAAVRHDPSDEAGKLGLARALLSRREEKAAVAMLETLLVPHELQSAATRRYALFLLGTAQRQLGHAEEAADLLPRGAISEPVWRDPWSEEVLRFRRGTAAVLSEAAARFRSGHVDVAVALLERVRDERRDDPFFLNQLATAYAARGRVAESRALLEAAFAQNPDLPETHINLAAFYMHSGDVNRALTHAHRATALDNNSAQAHHTKALVLWRTGRRTDAADEARLAWQHDPRSAAGASTLGRIALEMGRTDEALSWFRKAAQLDPVLPEPWVGIAMIEMRRGNIIAARRAFARAELAAPEHQEVQRLKARIQTLAAGRHADGR